MRRDALAAACLLALLARGAAAQPAPAGIGRALQPGDLAGMFAIPPDGTGLPAGQGSVQQGQAVYEQVCAACHGAKLEGQKALGAPPLVGGRGTLAAKPLKTTESYWPYATTLFDYIKRAMPMNAPGSLSNDQVYGVVAFILAQGHIVAQDAVMDAASLPRVRMPNRDGFVRG